MDNMNLFSDDQMAVLGCLAAIAACMLMMGLSFRFGTVNEVVGESDVPAQPTADDVRRSTEQRAA